MDVNGHETICLQQQTRIAMDRRGRDKPPFHGGNRGAGLLGDAKRNGRR
jgi:hypothetical protein